MRFIDPRKLNIPKEWKEKAKKATEDLLKEDPLKRSKFIEENENLWKELRPILEELSHGKCWYCETKPDGYDFDVDHYRPKNQIKNYDNHKIKEDGYHWLAFDYTNYRLACIFCNRLHKGKDKKTRGKAAFFPLCDGSFRCTADGDLNLEKPILLDPADPLDPPLLWFDEEGKAVPTDELGSGDFYERASKTIEILHLNNYRAKEHRRLIKNECDLILIDGDNAVSLMTKNYAEGLKNLRSVLLRAKAIVSEEAPFSSAAKIYLLSSKNIWVEKYLKRL
jgi:uncharacterized protein (TIGR02646 family)